MMVTSIGFCVASILLLQLGTVNAGDSRIIGGTEINISNAPYIMKIRLNRVFICGGTLVAPLYVVSAAHCYKGVDANNLLVVGGATKLNESGVARKVVKIFIPINFEDSTKHYDVAVLKLESPMTGTNIATIPLRSGVIPSGTSIRVSGWGSTNENIDRPSNNLRSIIVPALSATACQNAYKGRATLTGTMFCAGNPGTKDACSGDSGGPAVCGGELCGIVSWGIGCGRRQFPGVFTSINKVRPYIIQSMSE